MKNYSKLLDNIIIVCCSALLIITALFNHQYTFYTFVRWTITVSFFCLVVNTLKNKQFERSVFFISMAILFNPIFKIWFKREVWQIIDIIVSLILIGMLIINMKKKLRF